MDFNCFETFMGLKDWKFDSQGIIPDNVGGTEVMDVVYKRGTRTVIIPMKEVISLASEDFDSWFKNKTAGFTC